MWLNVNAHPTCLGCLQSKFNLHKPNPNRDPNVWISGYKNVIVVSCQHAVELLCNLHKTCNFLSTYALPSHEFVCVRWGVCECGHLTPLWMNLSPSSLLITLELKSTMFWICLKACSAVWNAHVGTRHTRLVYTTQTRQSWLFAVLVVLAIEDWRSHIMMNLLTS